jgi:multicomponent K+:H+ antiporter subunit G
MTAAEMPWLLDILIALFMLFGALVALIGSFGLAKLPDFYMRLHGPTKASTLGVGCVLLGSLLFFSHQQEGLSVQEALVTLFLFATAPVSAHMLGQAVTPIQNLGEEVAFDAVQATIDLSLHVTMRGDDLVVAGRDHHATARSAEAARCLVPVQRGQLGIGDQVCSSGKRNASRSGCSGSGVGLDEITAGHFHGIDPFLYVGSTTAVSVC